MSWCQCRQSWGYIYWRNDVFDDFFFLVFPDFIVIYLGTFLSKVYFSNKLVFSFFWGICIQMFVIFSWVFPHFHGIYKLSKIVFVSKFHSLQTIAALFNDINLLLSPLFQIFPSHNFQQGLSHLLFFSNYLPQFNLTHLQSTIYHLYGLSPFCWVEKNIVWSKCLMHKCIHLPTVSLWNTIEEYWQSS